MSTDMMNENVNEDVEAIAIIGMDGRFPGADDVNAYWNNLLQGNETITRFDDELLDDSVPRNLRDQAEYVRARGIIRDAECFDAAFFGIAPREAEILDPQQRVFLEMCWRALEDAGYAAGTNDALTGVFAGMSNNTYFNAHVSKHPDILAAYGDIPAMVANEKDYLTTRVAYKLNLRGPCINITTACSTSLVAVSHACNSLLDYQCDVALAGGISILCPQERGYLYQEGSIYSPDGHCRPFDADARGTVFGNGGGVVVLKRLSEALADNDTIHAVIRGAAMNNDGAGKVSFTAPGVEGQAEVIRMAQELAGIEPERIGYIEAHGTGTSLGDPIEIAALTRAFRVRTDKRAFCGIGSVKGNIGHLDAASGIAGLVKAVLALREKKLPATLHYRKPNPKLNLDESPFFVVDEVRDWPETNDGSARVAAVSSFGLGGTNAHVVLEEAPVSRQAEPSTPETGQLLVLSAKTEAALLRSRDALASHLEQHADAALADIAHTLQAGRREFEWRVAVPASSHAEAAAALEGSIAVQAQSPAPRAVFMFPGQGSQRVGSCEQLYRDEPLFRGIVDACADALSDALEFDLRDIMFGRTDNASELLDETRYTQPALFVIEYGLARLWMEWGVKPAALVGHSIGEFAAAALAGVFTPEDAVRIVAERGRLMQAQPSGSMLSVRLPEDEIEQYLSDDVTLAGINAPGLCVLAGTDASIRRMQHQLDSRNINCSVLRTSHAFHSAMMDPVVETFASFMGTFRLSPPAIDIISTATGRKLTAEEATDPRYWARQLREPVRFMRALETARQAIDGPCTFLETGPGVATATFAAQTFADDEQVRIVGSLGRLSHDRSERSALLEAAGKLWMHGGALDWRAMRGDAARRRVPLPTYRFERTRHWLDSAAATPERPGEIRQTETRATTKAAVSAEHIAPVDERPLVDQLASLLTQVSGIKVDANQYATPFAELGLDSLFLTQFSQTLRKRFEVTLKFRELLVEHNTITAISALIEKQGTQKAGRPAPAAKPESNGKAAVLPHPGSREMRSRGNGRTGQRELQALTDAQRNYLQDLSRRYTWKTSGSKAFVRTHRSHLADPRTASGFDPALKEMVYPIVTVSSSGARIQDVDGNAYIDLVNGFGSNLLGHAAPFITDAIRQQLKRGYEVGSQTPLSGRVARLLQALTGFERFSFCTTGSEAVQAALRVARTVTERDKVVIFADSYHGAFDSMLARRNDAGDTIAASRGIPRGMIADVEVLEYGSTEALERIRELDGSLAAVLVEPVQTSRPERYSADFLRSLRTATKRVGAALVFDEMVSGFRVHPGGVQGLIGVRADLAVYGKACGGGMPVGVLAGERRFMDALDGGNWQFNDDSAPHSEVTFFAGTYMRHPLALAATEASLAHLLETGSALQRTLNENTEKLVAELERHCEETEAPIRFRRFSSWFHVDIDRGVPYGNLLFYRLRAGGVHVLEGRPCFLSTAHTEAELAQLATVFRESLQEMRDAGFFDRPGSKPSIQPAARKPASVPARQGASAPPVPGARLGRRPDGQPGWFVPDPERPGRYRELKSEPIALEKGKARTGQGLST